MEGKSWEGKVRFLMGGNWSGGGWVGEAFNWGGEGCNCLIGRGSFDNKMLNNTHNKIKTKVE